MAEVRRNRERRFGLVAVCLALGLSQGCARSEPLHRTASNSAASQQTLPFRPDIDPSTDGAHPAVSPEPQPASALPFRADAHARVLPVGTLINVQLESSLSTAKAHAGDAFAASVAAPLALDGSTLIEPGTAVTGSVEAMQWQAAPPGLAPSGYFRLTLSAINIEGRQIALQTSSLFARGTPQESNIPSRGSPSGPWSGVRVPKGRHLTFRLTAPVTLGDPNSVATRQYPGSTTE